MEMEGKSSSMAAKMMMDKDNKKKLPVSSMAEKKKNLLAMDCVQLVNLWTFVNAFLITIAVGFGVAYTFVADCAASPAPWPQALLRAAARLMDDDDAASPLMVGMLWCSTPQAAAAALALLLPSRRRRARRAAAYAALALTVASRVGSVLVMVHANLGLLSTIGIVDIFFCALGDLLGFLALLRGEWGT